MGNSSASCTTFQKPIHQPIAPPETIVKIHFDNKKDIEMIDFTRNKQYRQQLEITERERQRKLNILLSLVKQQRDKLIKITPQSWVEKEEISRINYIVNCINTKYITDEHLRDIYKYIKEVIEFLRR